MVQAWIVRAGTRDEYEAEAFAHGVTGVGWRRVGDLSAHETRSAINRVVAKSYSTVSSFALDAYVTQLYVVRSVIQTGDLVVMLRSNSPAVAIGEIRGGYQYRKDLAMRHTRATNWLQPDVRRSDIGTDLLDSPGLNAVHLLSHPDAVEKLRIAAGLPANTSPANAGTSVVVNPPPNQGTSGPQASAAYAQLSRNLNYARNLTSAGTHLADLGVTLLEVTDVYRAAWVQAVAALDHWVRQELHERMLLLSDQASDQKPDRYRKFEMPLGALDDVWSGRLSLRDALAAQLDAKLSRETYQDPEKIRLAFAHVADVANLWDRVARILREQAGNGLPASGQVLQDQLREVIRRRNKIVHEYDDDPVAPGQKNHIAAADTMHIIDQIDQVAAGILVLLDGRPDT